MTVTALATGCLGDVRTEPAAGYSEIRFARLADGRSAIYLTEVQPMIGAAVQFSEPLAEQGPVYLKPGLYRAHAFCVRRLADGSDVMYTDFVPEFGVTVRRNQVLELDCEPGVFSERFFTRKVSHP